MWVSARMTEYSVLLGEDTSVPEGLFSVSVENRPQDGVLC